MTMKVAVFFATVLLSPAYPHAVSGSGLAIKDVAVVDVSTGSIRKGMTVVIVGDRIAALGETRALRIPEGYAVVEGRGKFLIPGLWDMHVHLSWTKASALPALVANGVTGVRDMGGDPAEIESFRRVPGDGLRVGPRLVRPGLVVDGPKPGSSYRLTVANEAEAREAVRSLKQQGMDFVKIHNALGRESYFALADESRKLGIRFAGHVPKAVSLEEACDAGQASLEHMDTFTEGTLAARAKDRPLPDVFMEYEKAEAPALVACLARRGVAVTPTLNRTLTATQLMESRAETDPRNVYLSDNAKRLSDRYAPLTMALPEAFLAQRKQLFPVYQRLVASMQRAGVLILAGTDLAGRGVYPGFSLHDELKALVDAGLTPLQALQTATRNPAKYLGRLADSGDVGKGKLADLVVLDANPLEDVRNTTRVNAVVLSGRYYDRSALDGLLALARSEARE